MKCEYHIIFQPQINIAKNQNKKLKNKNGKQLQYSFNTKEKLSLKSLSFKVRLMNSQ